MPYANLRDPQSLNLYSYVRNNPLKNHDPDGHLCVFGFIGSCSTPSVTSSISFPAYDPPITNPNFYAVAQGVNAAAPVVNAAFVATAAVPAAAFGVAALAGLSATTLVTGGTAAAGAAESPEGQQAINTVVNIGGTAADAAPGQIILQTGQVGNFSTALSNATEIAAETGNPVVLGAGNAIPFASGSVNQVVVNNVPIGFNTGYFGPNISPTEIQRILAPGGVVTGTSAGDYYNWFQGIGQ